MRFLVVTKTTHPLPMDMAPALLEGMRAWSQANLATGKMEQIWSFSGLQAGGGILNVDSLEELDAIMVRMPISPFAETKIFGLVDLEGALGQALQALGEMKGM